MTESSKVSSPFCLGIDIGGTKIAIGCFKTDTYEEIGEITIPTESGKGCREMVHQIHETSKQLMAEHGLCEEDLAGIGAASPGPINLDTGTIILAPNLGFVNEPLKDLMEEAFRRPVVVTKDTNAAVLCESHLGAGKGKKVVTYVTVSTGIGAATAIDGTDLWGGQYSAGEFGHFQIYRNGHPCACGGKGCLEQYASGTAIARIGSEKLGRTVDAREVFEMARSGDASMLSVVRQACEDLGYGLAALIQILDPDMLILGGSVMKNYDVMKPCLLEAIDRYLEPLQGRKVNLVISAFDGRQVMLGAAWAGMNQRRA